MASHAGSARVAAPVTHQHKGRSVATTGAITILRRTLSVLWITSLAAVVLLALAANLGPRFGLEVFAVRGGSMAPAIPVGAAVIAVRTEPAAIRVGDVATIRADNGVVFTHRVIEIDASEADHWLRTKGDANTTADAATVPPTSVIGVVAVTIPLAGYLIAMMATSAGIVSYIAYALALLLGISVLEEMQRTSVHQRRLAGMPDVSRA